MQCTYMCTIMINGTTVIFIANDIEQAEKKRAILLNACGPATYKMFGNLAALNKPSELDYEDFKRLMANHAKPKPSVVVERFQFHSRSQPPGETVAELVAQLKRLSEHCKFGTTVKEMLRDRLVCGLADTNIQRKLLAETDLTLDKALGTARAMEAAEQNAKTLQAPQPSGNGEVHAVGRTATSRRTTGGGGAEALSEGADTPCSRCGGTKHSKADCRFKSAVCHACKKRGHLARMCRGNRTDPGAQSRRRSSRSTMMVDEESGDTPSEEEEAYALYNIREPIKVVTANGKNLVMDLDTGAAVTIISEKTYHKLWPQQGPPIRPTTTSLKTYTGELIQVRGSILLDVQHNGQSMVLPAVLVRGSGPTLLGQDWLQELKLNWPQICHVTHSPELAAVLERHKGVFQNDLGS